MVGSGFPDLYDTSPHNLFPLVLEALVAGKTPHINGDSFPTPDGTCVRDYVHVSDLALPMSAAQALEEGRALEPVYNLGSGTGISVRAIMDAMARVTGIAFTPEIRPPRPGDPASDRRQRRSCRSGLELADEAQPRRHGGVGLAGSRAAATR